MYNDKAVIASDSLIVSNSSRKVNNLKNYSKIISFPKFKIGYAGECSIFTVLDEMSKDEYLLRRRFMRLRNIKDATTFFKELFGRLKDNLDSSPTFGLDPDNEVMCQVIIVTNNSIYSSTDGLDVMEHKSYEAIGSGEDLAMGAMAALYGTIKQEKDLVPVVTKVINIVCEHSTECGLPMVLYEV